MLPIKDVETWALRVLEQVDRGKFQEDSLVELKSELIEPYKMARRIAGHCNAARGETVLWIIGVDDDRGIVGWNPADPASYLPQIWQHFQGEPPESRSVSLEYSGKDCTALAFHSSRPPYLVKNKDFGQPGVVIGSEVPWRDGTSVRTAKRDEVMRLLLDNTCSPEIEVFSGTVMIDRHPRVEPDAEYVLINIQFSFYIMLRSAERLIFPKHRILAEFSDINGKRVQNETSRISFSTAQQRNRESMALEAAMRKTFLPTFDVANYSAWETESELIVNWATPIICSIATDFDRGIWESCDQYRLDMTLFAGPDRVPVKISVNRIEKRI